MAKVPRLQSARGTPTQPGETVQRRAFRILGDGALRDAFFGAFLNYDMLGVGQVFHFASFLGLGKGHYHTYPSHPALFGFVVECAPSPPPLTRERGLI